jgi:hypothetical protein
LKIRVCWGLFWNHVATTVKASNFRPHVKFGTFPVQLQIVKTRPTEKWRKWKLFKAHNVGPHLMCWLFFSKTCCHQNASYQKWREWKLF